MHCVKHYSAKNPKALAGFAKVISHEGEGVCAIATEPHTPVIPVCPSIGRTLVIGIQRACKLNFLN